MEAYRAARQMEPPCETLRIFNDAAAAVRKAFGARDTGGPTRVPASLRHRASGRDAMARPHRATGSIRSFFRRASPSAGAPPQTSHSENRWGQITEDRQGSGPDKQGNKAMSGPALGYHRGRRLHITRTNCVDYLRVRAQPLTKMRQLCDAKDETAEGLNRAATVLWDVYSGHPAQGPSSRRKPAHAGSNYDRAASVTVYGPAAWRAFTGKLADLISTIGNVIDGRSRTTRGVFRRQAFLQFRHPGCVIPDRRQLDDLHHRTDQRRGGTANQQRQVSAPSPRQGDGATTPRNQHSSFDGDDYVHVAPGRSTFRTSSKA